MANGELNTSRIKLDIFEKLSKMKGKYGTRIHISLGGHERSNNFGVVVTNQQTRKIFVENLMAFAEKYNLDGIDFDWEFPRTEDEFNGYIDLITEIQKEGEALFEQAYSNIEQKLQGK